MKRSIFVIGLALILGITGLAQKKISSSASSTASNEASVSKSGRNLDIMSGTQVTGQLQNSLDVKKARVGDEVVLKTTRAVRQNGQVVVEKGSRLIGRVTEVQQRARGNAASRVGVMFDQLQQRGNQIPINALITSITQARAQTRANDDVFADMSGSSSTRTSTSSSSSGGGGLLGGVGNTVGGIVNTTTDTLGGVTNTVGQTVGGVSNTVGGTLSGIQITQSANVSASGDSSSILSLAGGNLRLEKGTTFNLAVSESTTIGSN